MNNKLYIIFMFFIILLILSGYRKDYKEHWNPFSVFKAVFESPTLFDKIKNVFNDISKLTGNINNLATILPNIIKSAADTTLDIALRPARLAVNEFDKSTKKVETDFKNVFKILKDIFIKLKYFAQLLLFLINRAKICSEGADKVIKNYTIKTEEVRKKLDQIMVKMEICPNYSFKNTIKYCKNCIFQIQPLIKYSYEYTKILMKFYGEVLTYPELFPQGSEKNYCQIHAKDKMSKADAIRYAHKCNTCLHIQSVLKLGLDELKDFFKVIKFLFDNSKKFEASITNLKTKLNL